MSHTTHSKPALTKSDEDLDVKTAHLIGPSLEMKFDELKIDIVNKIQKVLSDSHNAREFISQKYDELCKKIEHLTELDATVSGFRTDVKSVEKHLIDLSSRIDDIEKKTICKECPSIGSSMLVQQNLQ